MLADERLVTIGEGEVEVAHEALLREWPRLRGWLEEDAQGRRLHLHLRDGRARVGRRGRDPSELYRGARLAAVLDWSAAHDAELNAAEREFVAASRAASQRSQRRLRALVAGLAALLALAVVAGVDRARAARQRPRRGDRRARPSASGARALVEDDLDLSLLLARQGVALDDSPQTRGNLLAALLKSPAAIGVLHGDGDRLIAARPQPGRAHAGVHRQRRHAELRRHAHAARGGTTRHDPRARRHHRRRSGSTTCGSAPTARGSPSAAQYRSSWMRAPIACSLGCGSVRRPVRLRAALLARRAHAARRRRGPVRPSRAASSASTRAPASRSAAAGA